MGVSHLPSEGPTRSGCSVQSCEGINDATLSHTFQFAASFPPVSGKPAH